MSEEGAFDEVVKGADAIAHVAFPMFVKWGWVKEVLEPAIKGATGLPRVRSNMGGRSRVKAKKWSTLNDMLTVNWSSASCTPPEKLYDPRLVVNSNLYCSYRSRVECPCD